MYATGDFQDIIDLFMWKTETHIKLELAVLEFQLNIYFLADLILFRVSSSK